MKTPSIPHCMVSIQARNSRSRSLMWLRAEKNTSMLMKLVSSTSSTERPSMPSVKSTCRVCSRNHGTDTWNMTPSAPGP